MMKPLSGTVLLGVVLTLLVIYLLRPVRSAGVVALIFSLCLGFSALIVKAFSIMINKGGAK